MNKILDGTVRVQVPASSANLGPGFDCLGIALTVYDVVQAQASTGGLEISVTGEGSDQLPRDATHVVVRAMNATFDQLGTHPDGLSLHCANSIPQERGMGSSAAAVTAGVLAARALVDHGTDLMPDDEVLRLVSSIEKRPDNAAPCLLGGFTIAWVEESGARAVRLQPNSRITPFVYVPVGRDLTELARAVLPEQIALEDATFNAQQSALLVHALTNAPELLLKAAQDRLHQPYRAVTAPGSAELIAELRRGGTAAVLSGAGPSVLALGVDEWRPPAKAGWQVLALSIDLVGARVNYSDAA